MGNPDWLAYGYSAAVTSGGLMGYMKAGSTISLAAGLLFGGIAGFGAYRMSNDPKDVWVSLGVSSMLGVMMGQRFIRSGKFMPAGLTCVLSCGMAAKCLYDLRKAPEVKNDWTKHILFTLSCGNLEYKQLTI